MNLLDENVREDQRSQLRTWGLPIQQIGSDVGRKGMKDEDRIGSWKLGATGNVNYRERPTAGTGPPGAGPPRTPRLKGTLPPAERARQAKCSGFFGILGEGVPNRANQLRGPGYASTCPITDQCDVGGEKGRRGSAPAAKRDRSVV